MEDARITPQDQRTQMRAILDSKGPGDRIQVTILRAGAVMTLDYFLPRSP